MRCRMPETQTSPHVIIKLSSKQCIVAPQKNWAKKTKKKFSAEGLAWPSAKGFFADGLTSGPRQRRFIKKNLTEKLVLKKSLPRAWSRALGKDFFLKNLPKNWFHREKKKTFAEGLTGGPRQSLTGNGRRDPTGLICRGHLCRGPRPSTKI